MMWVFCVGLLLTALSIGMIIGRDEDDIPFLVYGVGVVGRVLYGPLCAG